MNQVDVNIDEIDKKFPQPLFSKNVNTAENFAQIDEITDFPFLNLEYVPFMPKELEAQFNYRFNRYSQPHFNPNWKIQGRMKIQKFYTKPRKGQGQVELIDIKKDKLCSQFLTAREGGCVRSLVSCKPGYSLNVVLLHDFFQTPLQLIPVMNYLNDKQCQMNVVTPYIADITSLAAGMQTDDMVRLMTEQLHSLILHTFRTQPFQIVSQGASALLALRLQKMDLNCQKIIVMNPIITLNIKKRVPPSMIQQSNLKKLKPISSDIQTSSAISTSETNEHVDHVSDMKSSQRDSIEEIKIKPNYLHLVFKEKSRADPNARRTVKDTTNDICLVQIQPVESDAQLLKSLQLKRHQFEHSDQVIVQFNQIQPPTIEELFEQQYQNVEHGLFLVNDCIKGVYYDLNVMETIIHVLKVKRIEDLVTKCKLEDYISIYSQYKFQQTRRAGFYKTLLSLYIFSPMDALISYNIYKDVIDNYFFKMMEEMDYYIQPQSYDFDGPQNVIFLLGSNACMLSRQQLQDVLFVQEQFINIEARTVLGAGQDMFFAGVTLLERILQANG